MENEDFTPDTTPESEEIEMEAADFDTNQDEEEQQLETENLEENQEQDNQEEEQQQEPFLQVKFNKEDKDLSKEEAVILAQKGLNYDKVLERLTTYESDPALTYLSGLASRNNMSVDELISYWQHQEEEQQLNELVQQNIPEEYAKELLENKKFREDMQRKELEAQQQARQDAEFKDFFAAFPGLDPTNIPPEVWEKREQEHIPLKYAYMAHQNAQLVKEKEILLNNQKNKKKAPGLGTTTYGSGDATHSDPFLDGFDE